MLSSCVVNSFLGAELLRLASAEVMSWSPFSPSWLWVVADALCLGVGIYGAVEQFHQKSLPAQTLQQWLSKVSEHGDLHLPVVSQAGPSEIEVALEDSDGSGD